MGGVRGVAAAVLSAVMTVVACSALAQDETAAGDEAVYVDPSGPATEPNSQLDFEPSLQPRFLLFANTDLWRHGGFTHGGVVAAPGGLDREGFVFKLMFGGGVYHYISGALGDIDVMGVQLAGAAMPGWRFVRNGLIVTVFAGLDYQDHRLTPDDPTAGLRGSELGLRTAFELWYEPTANTMVAADASFSTVGPSYSARLAAGWRVFDHFYLGPELQGFAADDNYQQMRAGIHVTAFKFATYEWSAGIGWAIDSDDHDSFYGKLGVISRR